MAIPRDTAPTFLVELVYDEQDSSKSTLYCLEAETYQSAMEQVREKVGYNPGVPVRVTETPINRNITRTFYSGLLFEKREHD